MDAIERDNFENGLNIYRNRFVAPEVTGGPLRRHWTVKDPREGKVGQCCGQLVVQNDDSDERRIRSERCSVFIFGSPCHCS